MIPQVIFKYYTFWVAHIIKNVVVQNYMFNVIFTKKADAAQVKRCRPELLALAGSFFPG